MFLQEGIRVTSDNRHKQQLEAFDHSTPIEVAGFVGRLVGELKTLAQRHDLDFLAYLLEMAREEAISQSERIRIAEVDASRR
ncbi:MAG TPA: hypothetical protein PLG99_07970 [Kaistiaceae bacterium]|nr:hypothetical protein [Kaistiaceae bacterium]